VRKLTHEACSTCLRELALNISCEGCEPRNESPSMQEVFVHMPKVNSSGFKRNAARARVVFHRCVLIPNIFEMT